LEGPAARRALFLLRLQGAREQAVLLLVHNELQQVAEHRPSASRRRGILASPCQTIGSPPRSSASTLITKTDALLERNTQAFERNARAWGKTVSALEAIRESIDDMRDQIQANTRAILHVLDRLDNGGASASG